MSAAARSIPRQTLGLRARPRHYSGIQALILRAIHKQALQSRIDPRWVEAYMRLGERSIGARRLEDLNVAEFEAELARSLPIVLASTALENEHLAASMGL